MGCARLHQALDTRIGRAVLCTRLAQVNSLLATKRVPWMTALRVVRERTVYYWDTSLVPQLYRPNRLWGPGRVMGDSPLLRRVLPGAPPGPAGPRNISWTYGKSAKGSVWATDVSSHKLAPHVPPRGQKRIQKRWGDWMRISRSRSSMLAASGSCNRRARVSVMVKERAAAAKKTV